MKLLVECFVDGTEVDFNQLLGLGLIEPNNGGYSLTPYGKSFLSVVGDNKWRNPY